MRRRDILKRPAMFLGLHCLKCGRHVDNRYVATTYDVGGGVTRVRYCECGAKITSLEHVVGADMDGLVITRLEKGTGRGRGPGTPKSIVRQVARALGGTVTNL
jgi:hypothetical protein